MVTSGNGVNAVFPITAPEGMIITGYSGSLAVGFPGTTTGFYEVLLIGAWFPAGAAPTEQAAASSALNLVPTTDIGQPTLMASPGGAVGGNTVAAIGGANVFLAAIAKDNAPTTANIPLVATGLEVSIPTGGYLVIHLDGDGAAGQQPGNAELQLAVFYQ